MADNSSTSEEHIWKRNPYVLDRDSPGAFGTELYGSVMIKDLPESTGLNGKVGTISYWQYKMINGEQEWFYLIEFTGIACHGGCEKEGKTCCGSYESCYLPRENFEMVQATSRFLIGDAW